MRILHGDSLHVLKTLEADSIDACVTDPPYGLVFMNKHWDAQVPSVELWREVFRVLKPGAHMLSFGGTRTYHRMAVAIEDAGFEIRDQIQWIYGSGFPKSLDVSKAIDKAAGAEREVIGLSARHGGGTSIGYNYPDQKNLVTSPSTDAAKQWQGWGSALKPAHEPIVVARKPFDGPLYKNVLKHGTGGINVDASRIEGEPTSGSGANMSNNVYGLYSDVKIGSPNIVNTSGRFPSNVILACDCGDDEGQIPLLHRDDCAVGELDRQSKAAGMHGAGHAVQRWDKTANHDGVQFLTSGGALRSTNRFGDTGGASRFFYVAKTLKRERNAGLEGMPKQMPSNAIDRSTQREGRENAGGRGSRSGPRENSHPTVKPLKLMEYLIRMITPPGGTIIDPFLGSGSTLVAAKRLGFDGIGIEREAEYVEIARRRVDHVGSKDA